MAAGHSYPEQKYAKYGHGRRNSRPRHFLLLIAAVCALVLIVRSRWFVVREIEVTGNSIRSSSEIAGLSGLSLGMNIFNVDQSAVERNFSVNRYVELLDVSIDLPDTVRLQIRERIPCAAVNCAGVILLIDKDGYILDRMTSLPPEGNIIVIGGMDIAVNSQSEVIESETAGQTALVKRLLDAVYAEQVTDLIAEMNVSNPENLYIVSQSGIQVLIGDEEDLPSKLIWMRAVLEELTKDGVMRGVLDVSSGKNAVYAEQ